jgi:hypothetical protein
MNAVIMDLESIRGNSSGQSWVHTACLIPITMKTGKMSQYTMHTSKALVIKFNDVLNSLIVKEHLNQHMNNKHGSDVNSCAAYNIKTTRHMKFYPGMELIIKFIIEHGGILISHNLVGDLGFLVSTQNLVKGKRMIKNKLDTFPDTGMYSKAWESIKKVCSMSLFCNRCPTMMTEYKKWAALNDRNKSMNTLQSLVQFVSGDREYVQKHAAVQDTIDLFTVLKYAYKCDGPILDGYSYLSSPKWIKAV